MASQTSFTFIYATGSAYLSVESDVSKKLLKVGCLGMGPLWSISDHTWDYDLTPELQTELDTLEKDSHFSEWDECYIAAYEPDLDWEFIISYDDGTKKRSFGQGMKSERLDELLPKVRELVVKLSRTIHIDLSTLEAVYFCHVANGIYCAATLGREIESSFEKTKMGEKKFNLTPEQWSAVEELVFDPELPHFGFGKEEGTQFVSRALYLGGKMVSYTYGGMVSKKWEDFEEALIRIIQ